MNHLLSAGPALVKLLAVVITLAGAVQAQDRASVVAAPVVERDVSTGHRAVGTVMPVRQSTVGSAVDGRVIAYLVESGEAVTEGQPLAKLRTGTLEIELAAANAELTLRKEELAEFQNGSRPEEIAEAQARMLSARAVKKNAEIRLQRIDSLVKQRVANETELDDALESAEAARQTLLAAEAAFQRIEAGPREEQIAQAKARLLLQQEQVHLIEDRIAKFTIYAPFDGFITVEHTQVGEWLSQGDPVADVVGLEEVDLVANVPAEQVVQLQRGRDVRVEFPELPGEVLTGQIARIVPMADVSTRTFPVTIRLTNRIDDSGPLLMAGMLGRAVLPTGDKARLPLVPKDALVLNGSRRSVFVFEPTDKESKVGRVRSVPVTLGVSDGRLVQVDAPLKKDQLVIVLGNERLKDGQDVEITRIVTESESAAE